MKTRTTIILSCLICLICTASFGQQKVNLAAELQDNQIKAVNRTISLYAGNPDEVEMNAMDSDGMGILKDIEFAEGTIESVYFRPFNFVAEEPRKAHMVQYISHPENTWHRLREERTGEFENEIPAPPDPDDWFTAIIKITEKQVKVYMNEDSNPVLEVERLSGAKSKTIGIW